MIASAPSDIEFTKICVTSDITTSDPEIEKFLCNIYLMVKQHAKQDNCNCCKFILETALQK